MSFFNTLTAIIVACAMLGPLAPLEARNKKGDKFLAEGKLHEAKKEWDAALDSYEKAQSEDPTDPVYQIAADKGRFQAAQAHVEKGMTIRSQGQLGEALIEFQKAYAINPGSAIAGQELLETQQMIIRERKRIEATGKEAAPEVRALTPGEAAERDELNKINRMLPIPELRPMAPGLVNLKMTGKLKVILETLGKIANINVLWDPEFSPIQKDSFTVDFDNVTLDQALDYIAVISKTYWKALSPNTIFVTNDNPTKRRDYEEQVLKTFYLHNISGPTEMQEIVNAVRTVPELNKVFPDNEQYAIVVRGEADKVALATKIVHDLDRPRPEVLLDILILETSTTFNKQISAAIASGGLNVPISFSPRSSIQVQNNSTTGTTSTTSSTTSTTSTTTSPITTTPTTGTGTSSTTGTSIPISEVGHLSSADFATTLPSALLQAAMSDANTTVLQAPELRAVDNIKSTLNIGEREPTASGSFQPGVGGVGINPLVNTQFQYIDIGVNVEVLARVHSDTEVSMDLLLNLTTIAGEVNLGGLNQPIIGQRKIQHSLRMKEGEVAIIGGLVTKQDDKTVTGIPGLSAIPFLGNLFKGSNVDHNTDNVIIVVIPHIIRKPEFTAENLESIAVGNTQTVKINYAPPEAEAAQPAGALPPGVPGNPVPMNATTTPVTTSATTPATTPVAIAPPATAPPATAPPAPAPAGAAAPANGNGTLRFAPLPPQIKPGASFTVSLMLDNAAGLVSAPVQLVFDPKALKLNDVASGDLMSQGGVAVTPSKNIDNVAGAAAVQLNRPPGAAPVSGSGTLLTFSFTALAAGSTQITTPTLTLLNTTGGTIATGNPRLTVNIK